MTEEEVKAVEILNQIMVLCDNGRQTTQLIDWSSITREAIDEKRSLQEELGRRIMAEKGLADKDPW